MSTSRSAARWRRTAPATVESVTPARIPARTDLLGHGERGGDVLLVRGRDRVLRAVHGPAAQPAVINEQEPLPGTDVDTQTPPLSASAIVPGGYPANPTFSYAFRILNGPNPSTATVLQSSGWVAGNGNTWTPTTALTWGTTYYWQVTVSDAVPPPIADRFRDHLDDADLVRGGQRPAGHLAPAGQRLPGRRRQPDHDLRPGRHRLHRVGQDRRPADRERLPAGHRRAAWRRWARRCRSCGPTTRSTRGRRRRSARAGRRCWTCRWSPDPDGSGALILTLADGQQVRFAKNAAGGYAPPQNMYAVVTALSGGGFSVTDQTGTTYQLRPGQRVLVADLQDRRRHRARPRRSATAAATLTTITSTVSGRALHLTWSTPSGAASPHVATVATDPVDGRPAGHGADLDLRVQRGPAHLGVPAGHHHRVHHLRLQHQRLARPHVGDERRPHQPTTG